MNLSLQLQQPGLCGHRPHSDHARHCRGDAGKKPTSFCIPCPSQPPRSCWASIWRCLSSILFPCASSAWIPLDFLAVRRRLSAHLLRLHAGLLPAGGGLHRRGHFHLLPHRQARALPPASASRLILFNYYSVSLSEYTSSTAFGSLLAFYLMAIAAALVVRVLTKNDTLAWGVCIVLLLGIALLCFFNSSLFEGLLPALMEQLSLFERFSVLCQRRF